LKTQRERQSLIAVCLSINVPAGELFVLNCKVDFGALTGSISLNGTSVYSGPIMDNPENNSVHTSRKISFGASVQIFESGTQINYLKVGVTASGTRALHKEISVAALGSVGNIMLTDRSSSAM
jgi:hypothetical protein